VPRKRARPVRRGASGKVLRQHHRQSNSLNAYSTVWVNCRVQRNPRKQGFPNLAMLLENKRLMAIYPVQKARHQPFLNYAHCLQLRNIFGQTVGFSIRNMPQRQAISFGHGSTLSYCKTLEKGWICVTISMVPRARCTSRASKCSGGSYGPAQKGKNAWGNFSR
jgi:hypothetical protein